VPLSELESAVFPASAVISSSNPDSCFQSFVTRSRYFIVAPALPLSSYERPSRHLPMSSDRWRTFSAQCFARSLSLHPHKKSRRAINSFPRLFNLDLTSSRTKSKISTKSYKDISVGSKRRRETNTRARVSPALSRSAPLGQTHPLLRFLRPCCLARARSAFLSVRVFPGERGGAAKVNSRDETKTLRSPPDHFVC
jgi:hypothetical protein